MEMNIQMKSRRKKVCFSKYFANVCFSHKTSLIFIITYIYTDIYVYNILMYIYNLNSFSVVVTEPQNFDYFLDQNFQQHTATGFEKKIYALM